MLNMKCDGKAICDCDAKDFDTVHSDPEPVKRA